jgi:hypothetical protein
MQYDDKRKQQSTIEIINDYAKKTKHKIKDVKHIMAGQLASDSESLHREYKLWVYADDFENSLGITEERLHYLLVKKRWQEQYDWCDAKYSKYGKLGITIPLVVYEFLQGRKSMISELVVCIISDINRWKYTEVANYYYYRISLLDMHNFAKKQYTIFTNVFGEEVIGFPFSLFKKI